MAAVSSAVGDVSTRLDPSGRDETSRQRILYIGGLGRSGSTVLSLLLNSLPGFEAVGELRYIWLQGLQEDLLCACGRPFHACEFWNAVGEHAFGGWDQIDTERVVRTLWLVDRHRYLPLLLRPSLLTDFETRLREYREILLKVYRGVSAVSGNPVVVDSTKEPPFGLVVREIDQSDFRLVHLVRDSRGVAFSWRKQRQRPEIPDGSVLMNRYNIVSGSIRWLGTNFLCHRLGAGQKTCMMLRYEDLVAQPMEMLARVVKQAGEQVPEDVLGALIDGRQPVSGSHSIAGNPIRFDRGPLRLRLDDEWRSSMRPADRLVVTVLTAPLLRHYGYPVRVKSGG